MAAAMPSDEEIRKMAERRVGWKVHAAVYVLVNLALAGVWALTSRGGEYWPLWTHLGWGLGVLVHGFFAVGPGTDLQRREEERLRARYRGGR